MEGPVWDCRGLCRDRGWMDDPCVGLLGLCRDRMDGGSCVGLFGVWVGTGAGWMIPVGLSQLRTSQGSLVPARHGSSEPTTLPTPTRHLPVSCSCPSRSSELSTGQGQAGRAGSSRGLRKMRVCFIHGYVWILTCTEKVSTGLSPHPPLVQVSTGAPAPAPSPSPGTSPAPAPAWTMLDTMR